jgi:cytochrome P450
MKAYEETIRGSSGAGAQPRTTTTARPAPRPFAEMPVQSGAEPVLGHLRLLARRLEWLERAAEDPHRVSRMVVFNWRSAVVNHPDVVHEVLVEKSKVMFEKSQIMRFTVRPLVGDGLLTSTFGLWHKQRKAAAPLLLPSQVKGYGEGMVACARRVVDKLEDGATVDIARQMTRITMLVVGTTLFGADMLAETDEIADALTVPLEWAAANWASPLTIGHVYSRYLVDRITRGLGGHAPQVLFDLARRLEAPLLTPGASGRRMREAVALLDRKITTLIANRRQRADLGNDLLGKLISVRHDDGRGMSDTLLRDESFTLFAAGWETTASALSWTLQCLCRNPEVYAAVQREVDALGGDPTVADLPRLDLTLRSFKEALRLYPPAFLFSREASEDTTLDGYAFPKQGQVLICPYAIHRNPELWPEPRRFDPDRYLPAVEAKRHRLAWIPFGAGPRTCIGASFALLEGPLVLATLLRHVRVEALADPLPDPKLTLRPLGGMPMRITRRRPRAD